MTDKLVKRGEVAALLDVCPATVTKLAAQGELNEVRIGRSVRYRESEVSAFITKAAGSGGQAVKHG